MRQIETSLQKLARKSVELNTERRAGLRANCSKEVITHINGSARDTVRINNISSGGASLIIAPGTVIPNEFAIEGLVEEGIIQCQVAWKYKRLIGIKFIFPN